MSVPKSLTVSVHGESQSIFEPMAARCTTTTVVCSTCTWG